MKGSVKLDKNTGTYYFVVDVGKDPITGKRKQKKKRGFQSEEDARESLNYYLKEIAPTLKFINNDSEYSFMILNTVKRLPSQDVNYEYSTSEITEYYNTNSNTIRKILSRNKNDFTNNKDVRTISGDELLTYKAVKGIKGGRTLNLFNVDGVLRLGLLLQSNSISEAVKANVIKNRIPSKFNNIIHSRSRAFLKQNKLQQVLFDTLDKVFDIKTQVTCGNYRIDFVIDGTIAIECDEFGHKNYTNYDERLRESYISSKGYKIIRYNPDNEKENVFKLINKILHMKQK